MLLYEHFLNDYIEFRKKRHDDEKPSSKNKNQFTYNKE